MAQLDDSDPCRIQSADLDDRPLHRPGDQPVTAHERSDGRDLRMHQGRHDNRRGVLGTEQELQDSRKPFSDNGFVGRRTEVRELLRHLGALPRAPDL